MTLQEQLDAHKKGFVAKAPKEALEIMQQEKNLTIEILADPGNAVADAYGLRHKLPETLSALYAKFGIDLPKFNGDDS